MPAKLILLIASVCLALAPAGSRAAIITVTTTADSGPGSLRAALASATDGDTIDASAISGTILLATGELLVTNSVTILGPGPNQLAVNGNAASHVFHINPSNTVAISGLTITNGLSVNEYGGGIYINSSNLILSNCIVSGNSATWGGGIYNQAGDGWEIIATTSVTIVQCTVSGNLAGGGHGGGVYSGANYSSLATLTVLSSTLRGNSAAYDGGGIFNDGGERDSSAYLMISNSTFTGNSAGGGGGIANAVGRAGGAWMTLANTTLSGNFGSVSGGGIANYSAEASITNCTFSGNSTGGVGGGVNNSDEGAQAAAHLTIQSSTFSGNAATNGGADICTGWSYVWIGNAILNPAVGGGISITNIYGWVTSLGYNLSRDDGGGFLTATGDQINTDPLLGPLANYGGPVPTHALMTGSPAINAGDPAFAGPPDWDQRGPGFPRVQGGRLDIGAYETSDLRITAVEKLGDTINLSFTSLLGASYEVRTNSDLVSGSWGPLPGSIAGNGSIVQTTKAAGAPQQFYRIYKQP